MNKLLTIWKNNRTTIRVVLLVTLITAATSLLMTHYAFAQTQTEDPSVWNLKGFLPWALSNIARYIGIVMLWGASLFVYIAGQGLDFIVLFSVVKMGWIMNSLPGIQTAWLMARDATNLIFIFMLIYTGILMIIDANLLAKKGMLNYRRMLVMLVVAALLVNFSLFFTRAIVDISNVVATKLYSLTSQQSLSAVLMNSMSAVNIVTDNSMPEFNQVESAIDAANIPTQPGTEPQAKDPLAEGIGMLLRGLLGGVVLIVAGLSFIAISFFLILRFVLVLYLLITSPLYFAGMVWPAVRGVFGDWLKTLISQCLFPIVYFLLLLMILFFIVGGVNTINNTNTQPIDVASITTTLSPSSDTVNKNLQGAIGMSFSQLLQFILIVLALVGSLKISVTISSKGASGFDAKIRQFAGQGSNYLTRRAFNVAGGVAGTVAAPINRIPLVGKPLVGMAGGVGKAVGYGVNRFGQVSGTGDLMGSVTAGTAAGFGTMRDFKPIDAAKKLITPDQKKVEERLTEKKKELEKGVDEKNEGNLKTATSELKNAQLELDRAQQVFRNAKTNEEKVAALAEESAAEEKRDAKQEKLSDVNKAISRDKKIAVAEWRSNTSGGGLTRTGRSIRRAFSATERAVVSKSALESPKEAKDQLAEKADRLNVRLSNMIDTGKTATEITTFLKEKKNKITPAAMAFVKPSLLLNTKVLDKDGINPILRFMTPAMLTAFSKEEKSGVKMSEKELEELHVQLKKREAAGDNSIVKYLAPNNNQSDWLPDIKP